MKVIFLQDVPGAERKNDIKEVKDGYARNFLIPKQLAVPATKKTIRIMEERGKQETGRKEKEKELFHQACGILQKTPITFQTKTTEKGGLFKKIGTKNIADAIHKAGFPSIKEEDILLKEPIKAIGEYSITIQRGDFSTEARVVVEKK